MGLLDDLSTFASTPVGQGLLSATFAGLAGARRGQPLNNIGRAGMGGLIGYNQATERGQQQLLQNAQLEDIKNQSAMRDLQAQQMRQKMAYLSSMLGNVGGAPGPSAAVIPTGDNAPITSSDGLASIPMPSFYPQSQPQSAPQQSQARTIMSSGDQDTFKGVPRAAIAAELALNNGKNVGEWINKRNTPDVQVSNGYAYDKNKVQPGFLPQSNVSQNGQATVTTIGPDGLPRVSAPAGALQAYAQYRNADEAAKAGYDVQKVWNPETQRYEFMSRSRVIQNFQADQPPSAPRFNVTGNPAAFRQQLVRSGDTNAVNAFDAQYGNHVPPGISAEPSIAEQNSAKGSEKYTVDVAGDTAEQRKAIMEAGMTAPDRIAKIQQIGKLLSNVDGGTLTPQGTQLASAANSWGLKIDKNLPNKEAASALGNELALSLRSTAGGGGMPGSLSDQDRKFLVSMTPNMSQSKQGRDMLIQSMTAVEQRKVDVADMARRYEQKYGALDNNFFRQLQKWSNTHPLFKK